jgi:hypothetical protein
MKKLLTIAGGITVVGVALVFAQATTTLPYLDYLGLHIGAKSTDKIGFYGKTPIVQPAGNIVLTSGCAAAEIQVKVNTLHSNLVNLGLIKTNAP